ncbi:Sm-like protein LSM36B, partial [Cucurbita argyrosperma subsp. sororia]
MHVSVDVVLVYLSLLWVVVIMEIFWWLFAVSFCNLKIGEMNRNINQREASSIWFTAQDSPSYRYALSVFLFLIHLRSQQLRGISTPDRRKPEMSIGGEKGSASTKTPADFLKSIRGHPVVVKLNSGVDYRGILACLDGYMNIAMEQTEEYVNGQLKNKYGDAFIRGNNVLYISTSKRTLAEGSS